MEVESFASGMVLKLLAKPDSVIDAGTVIAVLGDPYEKVSPPSVKPSKETSEQEITAKVSEKEITVVPKMDKTDLTSRVKTNDGIKATLLVRNIARKMKVDLASVQGTGVGGLITKQDLENYIQSSKGGCGSR